MYVMAVRGAVEEAWKQKTLEGLPKGSWDGAGEFAVLRRMFPKLLFPRLGDVLKFSLLVVIRTKASRVCRQVRVRQSACAFMQNGLNIPRIAKLSGGSPVQRAGGTQEVRELCRCFASTHSHQKRVYCEILISPRLAPRGCCCESDPGCSHLPMKPRNLALLKGEQHSPGGRRWCSSHRAGLPCCGRLRICLGCARGEV